MIKIIHTALELRELTDKIHANGKKIGLVPTMGALHEGHLTLIRRAKTESDFVIVSIFVNPTQFGPKEDIDKYPRTLDADTVACESAGADVVFAPSADEMYPEDFNSWVNVESTLTKVLEGVSRPTHFRGVTTVCCKLFNMTSADIAVFGMKDYQQLKIVQEMVKDLNINITIIPVEIVREQDGLAKSSRNTYLSEDEHKASLVLSKALAKAKDFFDTGMRDADYIRSEAIKLISSETCAEIDYVEIADSETLEHLETIEKQAVILLAVRIGSTRLIDNKILV